MARQPTPTRRSPRTIALGIGIALGAAALLFVAFGLDTDTGPSVAEVAGSPTISGDPLPVLTDPSTDAAVGTRAPTVVGADFAGREVSITGEGAEVLAFMASWCPACDAELPELAAFLREGRLPETVRLTAVATLLDANRPNWPPQDWFTRRDYPGEVMVDDADGSVAEAFGLSGTPFWVLLHDGEVVARASGQISMEVLEQATGQLAAG